MTSLSYDPTRPDGSRVALAGNTVAVASGKGGVGKTWFSITLAHALSMMGQRSLLFDGDLGLANVDIQLGLMPKRDLGAVLGGSISLKRATEHFSDGGFDVIAGRSGSGNLATLPTQHLVDLQDDLIAATKDYDRVIFDLAAGIDRNVRQLATQAETILVLVTEEPTAMTDAYAFIKVVTSAKPGTDVRVVVNMAPTARDGERTYAGLLKVCQNFLKLSPPLAGIVRHDRHVRESIRAQSPILTRSPNAEAAQDVRAIAARLTQGASAPA